MEVQNRKRPENYILLGEPAALQAQAARLVAEEKERFPGYFAGKTDSFSFELRYVEPFEKNFQELKRLQGTAAQAAGRRDVFRGYIILDVSGYLTHHGERYLQMSLLFLADMSEEWGCIFLIDGKNARAARELAGSIAAVFLRDGLFCRVLEAAVPTPAARINTLCAERGVCCSAPLRRQLARLLEQGFDGETVGAMLTETAWLYGSRISEKIFSDHYAQGGSDSTLRWLLPPKEYDRLMACICRQKETKEGTDNEKETA